MSLKQDLFIQLDRELVKEIPIEKISINPYQPRRYFEEDELKELAQSIKTVGLIHPPLVRFLPELDRYELIAGERRYRAAQLAGMNTLVVIVRQAVSSSLSAQSALIENVQRVDLNPLEIAKALNCLISEFHFTQEQLANQIGKKRSTVANYLRLLSLPQHIQDSVSKNLITMGHAKAILSLDGIEKQNLLYELILRDDFNVREAEEAALRIGEKAKKQSLTYITRDFYLEELAGKLQHKLGTKVTIQGKGKRGRITLDYYSLDDLDRLLNLLGIQNE
jgi:ParB family chromosome partitioning protein